jgi:TolB-like protein/tetratricopeptide (TPR) repeat protein
MHMAEGTGDDGGPTTGVKPGEQPDPASPRKATLGDLFAELKRRRVFRVMVGYGIFAFAVLQVVEPMMHGLDLPVWTLKAAIWALAGGFPVALILAWLFDLTAQGVKRTPSTEEFRGISFSRRRLGAMLVAVGLVAALPGVTWYLWRQSSARGPGTSAAGTTPSIAVLAFADMSPGKDQEYFSDGIAEEVLNALAQVEGLKVIGRTSSFSFKGRNEDLRVIGQKLGVGTLLEGSVRRDGARVRVTAQLVRSSDGSHLWSQTLDRDLSGVFAIQEEIARAVVQALQVKVFPGATVARQGTTTNWEANQHYLLGRDFLRATSPQNVRLAEAEYERAVAIDPGFALAWAGLSQAIRALEAMDPPSGSAARRSKAAIAADRAIALAPNLADGYVARGRIRRGFQYDWAGAHDDFQRAYALAPGDGKVVAFAGSDWLALGRPDKAIPLNEKAVELDPLFGFGWNLLGKAHLHAGNAARAREASSRALELAPKLEEQRLTLCDALLAERRPEEALRVAEGSEGSWVRYTCMAMARHDLGQPRESQAALDALISECGEEEAYSIAAVHAWRGEIDRAFEWLERTCALPVPGMDWVTTDPALRSLHGDARWAKLLKKLNLPVD